MSKKKRKPRPRKKRVKPHRRPGPEPHIKDAHYRCLKCGHEWRQPPGMVDCPKCQHLYVKWVNYNDDDWNATLS